MREEFVAAVIGYFQEVVDLEKEANTIDLDSFVALEVISLDVFHDGTVSYLVGFWGPWMLEKNASIDVTQKLSNVVHPWGSTPGNSIRVFQDWLGESGI